MSNSEIWKYAKGGKRAGAGRPSKKQLIDWAYQRARIERRLAADADYIYEHYRKFIIDDAATARHAIDKFLPEVNEQTPTTATQYNFIQFNNHNDTPQLPPERLPITVLASDGQGEECGDGVAPEEREGQDGVKFRNF